MLRLSPSFDTSNIEMVHCAIIHSSKMAYEQRSVRWIHSCKVSGGHYYFEEY